MTYRLFDIGGSSVKTVRFHNLQQAVLENTFEVKHYNKPDWANFTNWLNNTELLDSDVIGISCAGFIEADKQIKMFRLGGWRDKKLVDEIKLILPNAKVFLLNDAEAHLIAHQGLYECPQMSISLGTSVGFAIADKNGNIVRTLADINFDIGAMTIPTKSSNNQVWWALGSNGLGELQNNLGKLEGIKHYGYRLGAFLVNICSIFRPKTVIISGGIVESCWNDFQSPMFSEFNHSKPDWLESPNIHISPFGVNAALVGIGKYILQKKLNE